MSSPERIDDFCSYQIEVRGRVDENDLNAMGPLQILVNRVLADSTLFSVRADQSGLIGLIRHLHGRGVVLLSVCRQGQKNP